MTRESFARLAVHRTERIGYVTAVACVLLVVGFAGEEGLIPR